MKNSVESLLNYNKKEQKVTVITSVLKTPFVKRERKMQEISFNRLLNNEQASLDFGNWLAGFTAGEGFFILDKSVDRRGCFGITLRKDDFQIIERIKDFLGCGNITYEGASGVGNAKPIACISITNADELNDIIVPLFEKCDLRAKKVNDFNIWKQAIPLLKEVKHRPVRWVKGAWRKGSLPKWEEDEINFYNKYHDDLRSCRKYVEIDNETKFDLPKIEDTRAFYNWFAGFTAGEGCFDIQTWIDKSRHWCACCSLDISIRSDDVKILRIMQSFLGCGIVKRSTPDDHNPRTYYKISNSDILVDTVIPIFENFPLRAKKQRDFEVWKKGVKLIFDIKAKPRIGKTDGGRGYEPKWTDEDKWNFDCLCLKLNKIKKYNSEKELVMI